MNKCTIVCVFLTLSHLENVLDERLTHVKELALQAAAQKDGQFFKA